MSGRLLVATALAAFAGSLAPVASTSAGAAASGCQVLTSRDAARALGGVSRVELSEQVLGSVRTCTISVVRDTRPRRVAYAAVRDWPFGGAKRAFDFTVKVLRRHRQPKGVTFVLFKPQPGLGERAYLSEVKLKGKPTRSVLVWTGETFIHALNDASSVSFAQLLALARAAMKRA